MQQGESMSYQIKVEPSGHTFSAESGETLLDAALRQGYTLPYGCKDGACGACKGKVLCGEVDHGKSLPHALTDADKAEGKTLYCCASALSDLVIEARQMTSAKDFPIKTLPARIETMDKPAPDVAVLSLKLPATETFQFHAGQYIDILLKDGRKRSFSMANVSVPGGNIELHIRHVPGGAFTEQVFTTMKARDILRFNGPLGTFYLRDESNKPVILLAGGTGFAPIKAIVEQAIINKSQRPMYIYWGAKARIDLYLPDLGPSWAATHSNLHYIPVLSAPSTEDEWAGRTGFVHEAVTVDFPNLADFQVYACGSPAMIDAAKRDFLAAGLPEEEFFADAFSFANQ